MPPASRPHPEQKNGVINSVPSALMLPFWAEKFNFQISPGVLFHSHFDISYTHLVIQFPTAFIEQALC